LLIANRVPVGGILTRGPGLNFIEGLSVSADGPTTPYDGGIWSDEHIEPIKHIIDFAHSQNQKVAIQLNHGGRKSSTLPPWLSFDRAVTHLEGGWPDRVVAPSAIPYNDKHALPHELTKAQIKEIVIDFVNAARRAIQAGVDVLEVHGAHGFLVSGFLSPQSNKRTDEYGGSFENRTRFALEIIDALRAIMPTDMPLFFRCVDSLFSYARPECLDVF
jgi:2,4-dienoyl-CoA reductase-like NADH-dependent reductase (Old Yellow Enzyme family)